MSQSKLMSFFSSATEKRKRDSDDSDESQPGPSTPKKTSRPRGFCDGWLVKYNWLYLENGKMKCHPCVNTRQNNPFSAGSGCTNFRNSTLVRHQKTSAHTDALKGLKLQSDMKKSMKSKRSVCDPLKLKMTPKVNFLGVTMTPENFFEGKTLTIPSLLYQTRRKNPLVYKE